MQSLGKFFRSVTDAVDFNAATLSGSVDVIVIKQPDGTLKSTPFHARFGKFKILKSKDKIVKVKVNGLDINVNMKLGDAGEAFFEEEVHIGANKGEKIEYTIQEKFLLPDADNAKRINKIQQGSVSEFASMLMMKHTQSHQVNNSPKKEDSSYQADYSSPQRKTKNNDIMEIEDFGDDIMEIEDSNNRSPYMSPQKRVKQDLALVRGIKSAPVFMVEKPKKVMKVRTLRPTSDQLHTMMLKPGKNVITYTIESNLQGTQTLTSHIYLWNHDVNIIISDIDGTITKTDFLGHMFAYFGMDWSQPGIAPLFQNIRRNGYHILYLTSRAIGQAVQTKDFLESVYQDGKMLPHGPMIMSPDRMLSSVKRELVFKRAEVFKMAVLKDIKSLFPEHRNPFHAGFGNRETDAIAYRSVGIKLDKVFIVNPKGHIHHHCHNDNNVKSYAIINTMLKEIFPGLTQEIPVPDANILRIDSQGDLAGNVEKVVH